MEYLSTLSKHTQAVNVVRWAPKGMSNLSPHHSSYPSTVEPELTCSELAGELLASAGDDGNVILWVPAENHLHASAFGSDGLEDKETWRTKHMCRSSGAEIYDLAWSPDGAYFIIGSMDNIARIYNTGTGKEGHCTVRLDKHKADMRTQDLLFDRLPNTATTCRGWPGTH